MAKFNVVPGRDPDTDQIDQDVKDTIQSIQFTKRMANDQTNPPNEW
jgi:hypothetical protein